MDGNWLKRVPSEALKGPAALQNLHLEDNVIGEEPGRVGMGKAFSIVPLSDQHIRSLVWAGGTQLTYVPIVRRPCHAKCNNTEIPDMNWAATAQPSRTHPPSHPPNHQVIHQLNPSAAHLLAKIAKKKSCKRLSSS